MTLKLYYAPGACSFVPHALLETAGEPFEAVHVKLHKAENRTPEYLRINPRGQVPVLVDGRQTITQIVAIVLYLHDRFPGRHFLPGEPMARARVLETLMWMNNTVHPTFTHVFMPGKFVDAPEAQAQVKAFNSALYRELVGELDAMARSAAERGVPWLGGEHFGPLDAYALTLLRWVGFAGTDPTTFMSLWAHVQRVAALPAVARAIERERLQLNIYKPAA